MSYLGVTHMEDRKVLIRRAHQLWTRYKIKNKLLWLWNVNEVKIESEELMFLVNASAEIHYYKMNIQNVFTYCI
jgi:hypothetical protein